MRRLIALVALGGCSFATMQSPHGSPPECVESRESPVVDVVAAVASPFLIFAAVRASDSPPMNSTEQLGQGIADVLVSLMLSTAVSGLFTGSAVYGFIKADRCHRAKRDYQQLMAAPPMPGAYVPPPVMPGPTGGPPPVAPLPMVPPGPEPAPVPPPQAP